MAQITFTIPDSWGELPAKDAALLLSARADYQQDGEYADYVAKCAYILTGGGIVPGEYHTLPGSQQKQINDIVRDFLAQEDAILKAGTLPQMFLGYHVPQSFDAYLEETSLKFWADMETFRADKEAGKIGYDTAIYACAAWYASRLYHTADRISESEAYKLVEGLPAKDVFPVGFFLTAAFEKQQGYLPTMPTELQGMLIALLATLPSSNT